MVFSSSLFLLYFFPVFFVFYLLIPHKFKNYYLLFTSILFYSWGAPKFVFTILVSIILNFYLVKQLVLSRSEKNRKILLWSSIVLNIGLLAYFKYANFFIENANVLLASLGFSSVKWLEIGLPIGISFFTFQSMTYTLDIYRGEHKPLKKLSDYVMYILLFPQLIAGPIVRFGSIADEIVDRRKSASTENILKGLIRFSIGLAKKVLIANTLGSFADEIFALPPGDMDTTTVWMGALAYSFQIYYDFSGYSDMAIGIGKMIGFTFPENFNVPYISKNITEFWRRWHMTLGQWMKNYLYIPLGGSKVNSKLRLFFNLWIVFLISGLWHGANWTFILWGAYHGLFLILDRIFYQKLSQKMGVFSVPINFLVVMVGWVLFRSDNLTYATGFLAKMFSFHFTTNDLFYSQEFWVSIAIATSFSILPLFKKGNELMVKVFEGEYTKTNYFVLSFISFFLLILSISAISASDFNPFIYFRF